jgi:hypothetical protein
MLHCNTGGNEVTLEQLFGKYMRLREELAGAYRAPHWRARHIDRLADEIVEVEREMARVQPVDEQTSDLLPGI